MASNRPITLEESLADLATFPGNWEIEASDLKAGRALVAAFTPFVHHLHACGLSASSIRRHINELAVLGSELIRRRHMDRPPSAIPPLLEVVDEEGGPLLHCMDEIEQRPFDTTCRALHRFLTQPEGKAVITPRRRSTAPKTSSLKALIADATADAHDREEAVLGFLGCLDEHVQVPFTSMVLGRSVTVTGFADSADDAVVAVCRLGRATQHIPVLDLPLPKPPPQGHEWIAAYRHWCTGGVRNA